MLVWFLVGEARPRLTKNLSEFKVFWLVFLRKDYLDDSTPCSSLVWLLRVFSSYLLSHRSSFLSQVHLSPDNNMAATPQVLVPLMFPQSVYHVAIPFSALWLNLKAETTKKNQLSEIKYGRSKAENWICSLISAFSFWPATAIWFLKAEFACWFQLSAFRFLKADFSLWFQLSDLITKLKTKWPHGMYTDPPPPPPSSSFLSLPLPSYHLCSLYTQLLYSLPPLTTTPLSCTVLYMQCSSPNWNSPFTNACPFQMSTVHNSLCNAQNLLWLWGDILKELLKLH